MAGVRAVTGVGPNAREVLPGDLLMQGESLAAGAIATVGAGLWTGAAIASGIIRRTGPVAGYTDTTDTASNILAALKGSNSNADVVPGSSFRLLFINTVAQAMTFAAGTGVLAGVGTLDAAASVWREYLVTVLNAMDSNVVVNANTTNLDATVTFNMPNGLNALPIGANPPAYNITPGATVTGTGIPAGTTVLNVTQGQGGITGVELSANATATGTTNLTFGPTIKIDALRGGTL